MAQGERVELRKSDAEQPWHWVIIAKNGEPLATSENYVNKFDAKEQAVTEALFRGVPFEDSTE